MEVKTYCINRGTAAEYYGLMVVEVNPADNFVLPYAPNNWKTENGAKRWAEKHGHKIYKE